MSRAAAGAAIRELRESRDWSLADLAAASGVSIMGLSYLERGARKPHKRTVQRVENGLGLPPGSYARLLAADDPVAELAELAQAGPVAAARPGSSGEPPSGTLVVGRRTEAEVLDGLEGYAEAQLAALNSVIERLPPKTSDEYETYILSVIAQCVKAETLAANSWRVAVNSGTEAGGRLLQHLHELEAMRSGLLARLPASLSTRFDRACARSTLPEAVIAALLGVPTDELWDIRNRGVIPPAVLPRIRAFADAVGNDEQTGDGDE